MSQKTATPPPPPAPPPPPEVESWLDELHTLTQHYQNHRRDQRNAEMDVKRHQEIADAARERAEEAVKKIAALMRRRCGPAFLAGLASQGAEDLERQTMNRLDGLETEDERWTLAEDPPGGIDLSKDPGELSYDDE